MHQEMHLMIIVGVLEDLMIAVVEVLEANTLVFVSFPFETVSLGAEDTAFGQPSDVNSQLNTVALDIAALL